MSQFDLSDNEQALLELLGIAPVAYFPKLPLALAQRLRHRGFTVRRRGRWYLTRAGLEQIGRTLH